jgi:lipopolysaccharide transport system ATP-binding protein
MALKPGTAVALEGLSKRYRLGVGQPRYRTLRDSLMSATRAPLDTARRLAGGSVGAGEPMLWALRDITCEIAQGEVVGIIGRNGAGKSTLLKILSRITEPTTGTARIAGRVGSMLEVGTGFHNELTGRENIYLNGAILGMRRAEIQRKFDEIVEFAGVERFVDTPVKHYSSGMYLRLAFAVAAHLEPEVLLVDEVLAVGDVSFQKKCLGKMDDVARAGRTVLFVSHNMAAIRSLCQQGLVLDGGRLVQYGPVGAAIEKYYRLIGALEERGHDAPRRPDATRQGFSRILLNGNGGYTVRQGESFVLSTRLCLAADTAGFHLHCILEDMHGRMLFELRESHADLGIDAAGGDYDIAVACPALWLSPGLYSLYFKALLSATGRPSARCESDRIPLDVVGASGVSGAVLHPSARWTVRTGSRS